MQKENSTIIEGLRLFNEKADKLFRLGFVKTVFETNTGVTISGNLTDEGNWQVTSSRKDPNEEAIDAFVLTFRYFIQDNERSSLRNLSKHYETAPIDEESKKQFKKIRKEINDFLDKPGDILFKFNNQKLTRRKILDTFIYGGLSHSNDKGEKALYDSWMQTPFKLFIENEFVYILSVIFGGIKIIRALNTSTIDKIQEYNHAKGEING
jgi:hypothetical protein